MLVFAALLLAPTSAYDPEIEAIMRRRKTTQKVAQPAASSAAVGKTGEGLGAVLPPAFAARLEACIQAANEKPEAGIARASDWAKSGDAKSAPLAGQCLGYAQSRAGQWTEATTSLEAAAALPEQDKISSARLWAQAGNAALIAGDAKRAVRDLDMALGAKLPETLATGEIHLDRARARVAVGDQPGARVDLNAALRMAPADPLAWLLSATLARRMNDLPLARQHIAEATKLARDDAGVALERGVILALSGGQDAGARAAFSQAAELAPGSETATKAQAYLTQLGPPDNGQGRPLETKPAPQK